MSKHALASLFALIRCPAFCLALCLALCLSLCGGALCEAPAPQRVFLADQAPAFAPDARLLELYVCPLLGADCMVLLFDGRSMLIDMGKAGDFAAIQALLDRLSLDFVDVAFNTHPHNDHLGSMKQLLATTGFGRFITVFPDKYSGESVIQTSALKAVRAAGVPVDRLADGDVIPFGDVEITVLRQTKYAKPNPSSAMLMIRYGDCALLLCADVTGSAQGLLAEMHDLDADIFKYPHHGLNRVDAAFLAEISPEYAIFTHGYANTRDAQKQLEKAGIAFDFATWGVIHVSCDGNVWRVEQELTEKGKEYLEKYGT